MQDANPGPLFHLLYIKELSKKALKCSSSVYPVKLTLSFGDFARGGTGKVRVPILVCTYV